jgi:hypothetical protein
MLQLIGKPAQRTEEFSALMNDIAQLDQRFPNRVKRRHIPIA